MGQWTIIDNHYGEDDSTEDTIEYTSDIFKRIDYFINNAGTNLNGKQSEVRLIVCEGDSWFQYAVLLPMIKAELESRDKNQNIIWGMINLAQSGDTLHSMLENKQTSILKKVLTQYQKYIKCVLLSAGGNDVIDNTAQLLDSDDNGMTMATITKEYNEICNIINAQFENTIDIFTHSYAYLCAFGKCDTRNNLIEAVAVRLISNCPWIEPHIANLTNPEQAMKIPIDNLFKAMNSVNGVVVADTRRELQNNGQNNIGYWIDEIHPKKIGMKKIAKVYVNTILQTNPNLLT